MRTLRQAVAEQMVRVHCVRPELVDQWVRAMDASEIKRRFKFYTGLELSAAGSNPRAGDAVPAQALRPATMTASSRHSIALPGNSGRPMPDSEKKSLGKVGERIKCRPPREGFDFFT
jgi:hypothetical protein